MALAAAGMTTLSSFKNFTDNLIIQDKLMPVLFIGHGSPMNGIEDNDFSRRWPVGEVGANSLMEYFSPETKSPARCSDYIKRDYLKILILYCSK
jgi:hypothetical protein